MLVGIFIKNIIHKAPTNIFGYGTLAHVFQDLWNSTDANVVLCFLQFWQIDWGTGNNLTNIDGFSKVLFEPNDVPEIDAFRNR
ncbi:hypothetical protein Bca4012_037801 [Brassica carinata]